MLNNFGQINFNDISELKKNRDLSVKKYSDLLKELNEIDIEIVKNSALLQSMRTELALKERESKDIEKYIFEMKRKQIEVDEASVKLINEIESKEKILEESKKLKLAFHLDIENIEKSIKSFLENNADLEKENKELYKTFDKLDAEMKALSEEIDKSLSNTSLNRKDVEEKAEKLNFVFINAIEEQQNLNIQLSEQKIKTEKISESVFDLKNRITLLEEIKKLKEEEKILKQDVFVIEKKAIQVNSLLSDLTIKNKDKKEKLSKLSTENLNLEDKIGALFNEVEQYEKYLIKANKAKEKLDNSNKTLEENLKELQDIIICYTILEEFIMLENKNEQ
ncbi:MAG: hypothetical protein HQK79_11345 [Desulfobacterales bacterium]|nr:hypothetical protein [Desulfobacterales bacterium]